LTPLAVAVERKQWDVVALRLLLGVALAAQTLPPESIAELLGLLGAPRRAEGHLGS
jgi:hypothetical protein